MTQSTKQKEKTLVVIKPDGVQRALIGELIGRYERTGLKLIGLKMFVPKKELIEKHYTLDSEWIRKVGEKSITAYQQKNLPPPFTEAEKCGEFVLGKLVKYMSSGPVVAMVWQGNQAVGVVRKITGATEPLTSDVGTIRGDLTVDSYDISDVDGRAVRNLVHASGSVKEAEAEIALWFEPGELVHYRLISEAILYDVNLDGILE
ncbi:MAG: nucleoside-diphosphate kinase [Candidatus Portnoybacteria bacterium CG10_big_fil_rev_8_21_14_0_10_44_7]|uniref:nucleoside-diphosphate kinase n=1 Tax=Candidatus Portnoybacteria bacterium CG10_big_fil_rev_8_21_14_0_10_44_7 TaxID=1974816 RepID=A0A2M8KIH0_9BACT|nr:MAG: nucleoside-diphosphate kinase [Candidatus Portnoybacteria bacterium CG10_big_fil_rev_8_21_14_0_10_44_7]